jgi:hypothetical protein
LWLICCDERRAPVPRTLRARPHHTRILLWSTMRRGALRLKQLVGPRAGEADVALAERLMSCSQAGPSCAGSLAAAVQRAGFSSFVAQAY